MENTPLIDLRLCFSTLANTLSILGLFMNILLFYLIIYKTPKKVAEYKIILLQNCFVDLLFDIVNDVFKGQSEYKAGAFYLIGADFLNNVEFPYFLFLNALWVFSLFYCAASIPVQFVYRYFIICHGRSLKTWEYLSILATSIFGALTFTFIMASVFWDGRNLHTEKAALLQNDPYYFRGVPMFVAAEIQQWPLIVCFGFGYIHLTLSYGITIIAFWKVWQKLKIEQATFSTDTKRMHSQMTKTMILQAIVPLFFVLCPIGSAITATFAKITIPGLGFFVSSVCCWIPVINPLMTIISIKIYRKTIVIFVQNCFKCFCRNKYFVSSSSVHATATNGGGSISVIAAKSS